MYIPSRGFLVKIPTETTLYPGIHAISYRNRSYLMFAGIGPCLVKTMYHLQLTFLRILPCIQQEPVKTNCCCTLNAEPLRLRLYWLNFRQVGAQNVLWTKLFFDSLHFPKCNEHFSRRCLITRNLIQPMNKSGNCWPKILPEKWNAIGSFFRLHGV